jgi:hypothetical protein
VESAPGALRFGNLQRMATTARQLQRTPLTGFFRAGAWLLIACLLLGTLPMRAWAGAAAEGRGPGHAGVNAPAMPPCHGDSVDSAPHADAVTPESVVQDPMALHAHASEEPMPLPTPSATGCDCCLACSPAAAGSAAKVPALPEAGATLPTSAPHAPLQAQRDGVFRPPRA